MGTLVFVVILSVVGILMQNRMRTLLYYYVEKQAIRQAKILSQTTEEKFEEELRQLEWTADFIQQYETERQAVVDVYAGQDEQVSVGLLEMDGHAVTGETLDFMEFEGIRRSFRGESAVSYGRDQGLLFTVPVYRDKNVRYVLYKLYDKSILYDRFGISCYEGQGSALIMDRQEQVIIPAADSISDGGAFMEDAAVYEGFTHMREQIQVLSATSTYVETPKDDYFLFASEMPTADMLLVGIVPEDVAMEGISYLAMLVFWVFGLLFVVLIISMAYLFGAEEKARESDELREAKMIADKANNAKSDFLANMSHEIRTPINAVMGMNEMILRECKQEKIKEYALNIQRASQTLLSLINDILDISKIESGKMEIIDKTYDVAAFLCDVVNMVRVKAEEKNLWFYVNVDETIPSELWGDATRNKQILINILNNAVKYTREGGVTLSVTSEPMEGDQVLLKIQVADTGIGIKKQDMDKLFRSFERLDLAENRNVEGTGLGLAITYRLAEQMKGTVRAESEYGVGSTFTVCLPQGIMSDSPIGDFRKKYRVMLKQEEEHRYRESFTAPDAKILVVDDTSLNLTVITQLLKKTRVQVDTCLSGKECLYMAQKEHYDVILLDHMMPEMDGIETLRSLKDIRSHKCKETPVIALTANAIVGVREMYLKEGFADYLSKPVEGKDLEEMLRRYIPKEKIRIVEGPIDADQDEKNRTEPDQTGQDQIKPERKASARGGSKPGGGMFPADSLAFQKKDLIDIDMGIRYCADSVEVFEEALQEFCDVAGENRELIEGAFQAEDWKNYTIHVHGLKSSALSVGAKKLSDEAASLEQAGKELQKEDAPHRAELIRYIKEYHGRMMKLYEDSTQEGRRYLEK